MSEKEELKEARRFLEEAIESRELAVIVLYNGRIPPTIQRGRFCNERFQQCGGGRRIIRKKIGGT